MPKFNTYSYLEDLAMTALVLDEEKHNHKLKNIWIRKIFTKRTFVEEYHALIKKLEEDDLFFTYISRSVLWP